MDTVAVLEEWRDAYRYVDASWSLYPSEGMIACKLTWNKAGTPMMIHRYHPSVDVAVSAAIIAFKREHTLPGVRLVEFGD